MTGGRPGQLRGLLEENTRAIFQPFLADDVTSAFNQRLIDIAYQAPRGFPVPFTTDGEKNADRWLSQEMHLDVGDVRADFVLNFSADWHQASTELDRATYPGTQPDHPFSAADFTKVKSALQQDVSAYNRVRHYLAQVVAPLTDRQLATYVDLKVIGQQIQDAITPPPQSDATSRAFSIFSSIVGVASGLPFDVGTVATAFSTVLSVASKLSAPDGSQIGGDITAKVNDLAPKLVERFDAAARGVTGLTLLVVGDGGKLTDMAARLNDADWKLPVNAPTAAADSIRKGAARWFYSALMPEAYGLYALHGTSSANDYECRVNGYQRVFRDEPANGQDLQISGFGQGAAPQRTVLALGNNVKWSAAQPFARTPPPALVDPLFQPADQPIKYPNGLGMYKPQFFSTANFKIQPAPAHRADCA